MVAVLLILGKERTHEPYTTRPDDAMSIVVMTWVFQNSEATLGQRLVLLALAEFAHDDGTEAWPSVDTLVQRTRLSERQVQYALRALQDSGQIEHTGKSKKGTRVYRVVMEGGAIFAPPDVEGGAIHDSKGVQSTAPDPSLEPSLENPPVVPPSTEVATRVAISLVRANWSVDRVRVDEDEAALAVLVLHLWNQRTGQSLSSKEWMAKIVMRHREHPELTGDDHAAIIAVCLDEPWWKGDPSPSVVYGNGALFERCIEATRRRANGNPVVEKEPLRYGRGMTTKQMLEATRGDHRDG